MANKYNSLNEEKARALRRGLVSWAFSPCANHLFDGWLRFVYSAQNKPPVLLGEMKSFSENKHAELYAGESVSEKITSQYNRNGLAAALLKYRRLKT